MSAQHTPTPWEAVAITQEGQYVQWEVRGASNTVATVFYVTPKGEADAKLIARAVNSHDKLLAALEEALPALSALALEEKRRNARVVKEVAKYTAQQSYANAVAAIAEAKGEA